MSVRDRKTGTNRGIETVGEWFRAADPSFTEKELVSALEEMSRRTAAVDLPAHQDAFWNEHSGISASPQDISRASASNAAARMLMDSAAHSAGEVAERLLLSASTVRHYRAARKLYSYLANGRLVFPDWQFNQAGDKAIPSLEDVLAVLPKDLHPQSVAGFFLTPQPDLVLHGNPVSAKEWLEAGGSAENIVELAADCAASY